ncbi:phage antirepressor [Methylorubrum aminovorans]|uniref:phage antirepressor n=2 Tax=Methylorubrum aminovorans TaxID=269069 RepID=UPI003C2F345A
MLQADTMRNTLPAPAAIGPGADHTFKFGRWPVRVFGGPEAPEFVAIDVCSAIGIRDVSDAVAKLDPDEKGRASIPTPGGRQELLTVTESGLYTLILRARSATTPGSPAHTFKRWVTAEVLPSIRRTGSYAVPAAAPAPMAIDVRDPRQLAQIAMQLVQVNQEQARELADLRVDLAVAETAVELQRPAVEAYEAFVKDTGVCNLRSAARAIEAPSEVFFEWLKERGWLVKEDGWLQPGWERSREGHFVVRTRKVGGLHVSQTYVTRAGLVWLRHRWLAKLTVDAKAAERARIQGVLGL